jgi:hypothetical protein
MLCLLEAALAGDSGGRGCVVLTEGQLLVGWAPSADGFLGMGSPGLECAQTESPCAWTMAGLLHTLVAGAPTLAGCLPQTPTQHQLATTAGCCIPPLTLNISEGLSALAPAPAPTPEPVDRIDGDGWREAGQEQRAAALVGPLAGGREDAAKADIAHLLRSTQHSSRAQWSGG